MKKLVTISAAAGLMIAGAAFAPCSVSASADEVSYDFTAGQSQYTKDKLVELYGDTADDFCEYVAAELADFTLNDTDNSRISDGKVAVDVYDKGYIYTFDDIGNVIGQVFLNDLPQFYWLNGISCSGMYDSNGSIVVTKLNFHVKDEYALYENRAEINNTIINSVNSYHSVISSKESKLDKLKALNEKIVYDTNYDFVLDESGNNVRDGNDSLVINNEEHTYTIVGCLTKNRCVCDGYSKAFQLISNYEGIYDAVRATGTANGGAHAWNGVLINGSMYYIDTTWNDTNLIDQSGNVSTDPLANQRYWYEYFLLDNDTICDSTHKHSRYDKLYGIFDYPDDPQGNRYLIEDSGSMTLKDDITYSCYYEPVLDEYSGLDYTMQITIDNKDVEIKGKKVRVDDKDRIVFDVQLPAKNISEEYDAVVTAGDGTVNIVRFCAEDYLFKLYKDYGNEKNIAAAILNYATAAQKYKSYNLDKPANEMLADGDKTVAALTVDELGVQTYTSTNADGVTFAGTSLDMLDKTMLKVYFKLDDAKKTALENGQLIFKFSGSSDSGEYTLGDAAAEKGVYGTSGNLYWIKCPYSPEYYSLDTKIEIGGAEINYSVYDYFYDRLINSSDELLKGVVSAMYRYGTAAQAYKAG